MISQILGELYWTELEGLVKGCSYDGNSVEFYYSRTGFIQKMCEKNKTYNTLIKQEKVSDVVETLLSSLDDLRSEMINSIISTLYHPGMLDKVIENKLLNENNINVTFELYRSISMSHPRYSKEDFGEEGSGPNWRDWQKNSKKMLEKYVTFGQES